MKRRITLLILIITLLTLSSACKGNLDGLSFNQTVNSDTTPALAVNGLAPNPVLFDYSQKFADTALAYYLGRDFDTDYSLPLYAFASLGDDNKLIQLDPEIERDIGIALYRAAILAGELPGIIDPSVSDTDIEHDENMYGGEDGGIDADWKEGEENPVYDGVSYFGDTFGINPLIYTATKPAAAGYLAQSESRVEHLHSSTVNQSALTDEEYLRIFFPDGTAPGLARFDARGSVTAEFRAWFLNVAVSNNLLDPRLFCDGSNWYVYAFQCAPSKGGAVFRVFDRIFMLSDNEVGVLMELVKSDPKYSMVCESYIYFDNGDYTATYVTDPSAGADMSVRCNVSFSYKEPSYTEEYESDLERYLSGIYNLTVSLT